MHRENMHTTSKSILTACGAFMVLGMSAIHASAQTYARTGNSIDDLPLTAQITAGVGGLTTITGTLTSYTTGSERTVAEPSYPDLFEIYVTGTTLFSATTVGEPTTLYNPELFLFDSSGDGVYFNNDASPVTRQATIAPTTELTAGTYYIGIGTIGAIPRSGTGKNSSFDIFPDPVDEGTSVAFTGLSGPAGPGGADPLASWDISSTDVETGSYTIALTGATFAVAPEPPQIAIFGLGIIGLSGLILRARRRRVS
jgi:hypothetical protein